MGVNSRVIKDLTVTYKYVLQMPSYKCSVGELFYKITSKHNDDIMQGRSGILIAPIYMQGGNIFWQPVFDLDFSKSTETLCIEDAKDIYKRIEEFGCCIEFSGNGYHVVGNFCIKEPDTKNIENILKTKYRSLDFITMMRMVPIYRMGSFKDNLTVIPVRTLTRGENRKALVKKPGQIFSEMEWYQIWKKYLFLDKVIDEQAFCDKFNA